MLNNNRGYDFFGDGITENTEDMTPAVPYAPEGIRMKNRHNPFENPTENADYRCDYRKIAPQLCMADCEIYDMPADNERRRLKQIFGRTGLMLLFYSVISAVIYLLLRYTVSFALASADGIGLFEWDAVYDLKLQKYMERTSIEEGITMLSYFFSGLFTIMLGLKIFGCRLRDFFKDSSEELTSKSLLIYLGVALLIQTSSALIVAFLSNFVNVDYSGMSDSNASVRSIVLMFITSCIFAPIIEEIIFRGIILKCSSAASQRFGILITAFLFGLLHGNLLQFAFTFPLGILLGVITIKYNSVIPAIIVHAIVNMRSGSITILEAVSSEAAGFLNIIWLVISVVGGIAALVFFAKSERMPKATTAQKKRSLPVALTSVSLWVFMVIYGGLILRQMI